MAMSRKLNEKEFEVELEKLNKMEQEKIVITLLQNQTSAEEILDLLKDYDEVHVLLNDGETLRICHNNRYWIGNQLYGFNASSKEKGFTVKNGLTKAEYEISADYKLNENEKRISVNFTGTDKTKEILNFLLSL